MQGWGLQVTFLYSPSTLHRGNLKTLIFIYLDKFALESTTLIDIWQNFTTGVANIHHKKSRLIEVEQN